MGWVVPLKQADKIPTGPFLNIPRGKGESENSPSTNFAVLSRLESSLRAECFFLFLCVVQGLFFFLINVFLIRTA